jgi:hypothetical protein
LPGTKPQRQQDRGGRLASHEGGDQLDRGAVAPVQVVQHEHQRVGVRNQPEQLAHGAMSAVALVRDGARRAVAAPQRGQQLPQLGAQLRGPGGVLVEVLGGHVSVEGVHPDAERQLPLELGGRSGQHDVPPALGPVAQLAEQARLADTGFALDRDTARAALI